MGDILEKMIGELPERFLGLPVLLAALMTKFSMYRDVAIKADLFRTLGRMGQREILTKNKES